MKSFFLTLIISLLCFSHVDAFRFEWAVRAGNTLTSGSGPCRGYAVAVDAAGNVYTVGTMMRTVNFNPAGTPATNLAATSNSYSDVFIWKLNASGALVWAKKIGGSTAHEDAWHIMLDSEGGIYVAGRFRGTVNFNPAGTPASNMTGPTAGIAWNGFVLKLNSNGEFAWARQIPSSAMSQARALAIDHNDNIYVTGFFIVTAYLNPGGAGGSITASTSNTYILKLRKNNDFMWVKTFTSAGENMAHHLALDAQANVYTTGHFRDATNFNPGTGTPFNMTPAGARDFYISKLDSNGNFGWAKQFKGANATTPYNGIWTPGVEQSPRIVADSAGNVYYTNHFVGTMDLNPGTANYSLTATGAGRDIFIVKLNTSGDFVWARKTVDALGGLAESNAISVDRYGNIFSTGYFGTGAANFDPGGTFQLTSKGSFDIFLSKLDASGNFVSAAQMGGANWDEANHVLVQDTSLYLTGRFWDRADFDPHPVDSFMLNISGTQYNIFTVKLTDKCLKTATEQHTTCGSFTWKDGNTYTTSNNTATVTFKTATGCDSVITLDLTITPPLTSTVQHTACDSFTWIDGNTYTATSSTAADSTFKTTDGCDSIVTLDLTINHSYHTTDQHTACDSFTWIDGNTYTTSNNTASVTFPMAGTACDSSITLDLTINYTAETTDEIEACKSFTWIDGNTYTTDNNTAIFTLSTVDGCDSIVTLNLSVFHPEAIITVNHFELGTTRTFATYQWLFNGTDIPGATQSTYAVDTNGNYQVAVTDENGCTDTSDVYPVNNVSVHKYGSYIATNINIYPNPARDVVYINSPVVVDAMLTSVDGRSILRVSNAKEIPVTDLAKGIYFLHILDPEGHLVMTEKIIVRN